MKRRTKRVQEPSSLDRSVKSTSLLRHYSLMESLKSGSSLSVIGASSSILQNVKCSSLTHLQQVCGIHPRPSLRAFLGGYHPCSPILEKYPGHIVESRRNRLLDMSSFFERSNPQV